MAEKNDLSVVSYTIGIISIVMSILAPLTLSGVVFGFIGLLQTKNNKSEVSKKAKKLNIIGIILGILTFIFFHYIIRFLDIPLE